MARSSKSHDKSEEKSKPSYPYVVYASWTPPGGELRWLILKFRNAWGARNMINALMKNLLGGAKYELKNSPSMSWHYMQFENGMKVSLRDNDQYTEVMELEFDEDEAFVSEDVQQFKYGSNYESHHSKGASSYDGDDEADERPNNRSYRRSRNKVPKPERPKKGSTRKPRFDKTGYISANEIAKELGVTGREVRGVLRGLHLSKPEGGWLWKPDEAKDIKKKIKAGLKK